MTSTTPAGTTGTRQVEQPLDEAAIVREAAAYADRLLALTGEARRRTEEIRRGRRVRQDQFDVVGLPRGVFQIETVR